MALYYDLDQIYLAYEAGELTAIQAIQEAYDLGYGQGTFAEQSYDHTADETDGGSTWSR